MHSTTVYLEPPIVGSVAILRLPVQYSVPVVFRAFWRREESGIGSRECGVGSNPGMRANDGSTDINAVCRTSQTRLSLDRIHTSKT